MTENIFNSLFLCLLYLHVHIHTLLSIFKVLLENLPVLPRVWNIIIFQTHSVMFIEERNSKGSASLNLPKSLTTLSYSSASVLLKKSKSITVTKVPRCLFQVPLGQPWEVLGSSIQLRDVYLNTWKHCLPSFQDHHVIRIFEWLWDGLSPRPMGPWDQCFLIPAWSLEERDAKGHKS